MKNTQPGPWLHPALNLTACWLGFPEARRKGESWMPCLLVVASGSWHMDKNGEAVEWKIEETAHHKCYLLLQKIKLDWRSLKVAWGGPITTFFFFLIHYALLSRRDGRQTGAQNYFRTRPSICGHGTKHVLTDVCIKGLQEVGASPVLMEDCKASIVTSTLKELHVLVSDSLPLAPPGPTNAPASKVLPKKLASSSPNESNEEKPWKSAEPQRVPIPVVKRLQQNIQ